MGSTGLMYKLTWLGLIAAISSALQTPAWAPGNYLGSVISGSSNKLSIVALHEGVHVVSSGETHVDFTAKWNGHGASVEFKQNLREVHRIEL